MGRYNRRHRHGERTGQGGGGGNGGGGGGGSAGLGSLSDITSTASGHDLVKLARAMAKVEIKPQVSAYRRLIRELQGQEAADTVGLNRLGQQTQRDIQSAGNAYDVGAQGATARTQAVGNILSGQLAQQGQANAAEQVGAQTGTLGGLQQEMQTQGAPQGGAAQQALGNLVAQQASRRAAETQAGAQFATSQQGSYGGLLEGMRTAGNLQTSTSRQNVGRDIASRIAETRLQAGQDIREAMGKKADVKATKGATILSKLAELRGQERDFLLGEQAVATDRRGQNLSAQSDQAQLALDQAAAQLDAQQAAETHRHNVATEDNAAADNNQGSGAGRGNRQQAARDRNDAIAAAKDLFHTGKHAGDVGWYQNHIAAYIDEIQNRTGVPYSVAHAMAMRFLNRHSGGGGGTSSVGPTQGT